MKQSQVMLRNICSMQSEWGDDLINQCLVNFCENSNEVESFSKRFRNNQLFSFLRIQPVYDGEDDNELQET